jgi:nicotinamide mononucleotide transporter
MVLQEYLQQNWLEDLGILTTLICVWLNIRQNIWGWFWAVISSAIYGVIYWQFKLYSDMELQVVFIVISIYGWYQWKFGGNEQKELPVTQISIKYLIACGFIFVGFTAISGYLHGKYSDASLPYLDSSLTAISLIAQWMMARKYVENWLLWMVANICYTMMYYYKGLHGTSVLYVLLLAMAVKGYFDWKRSQTVAR